LLNKWIQNTRNQRLLLTCLAILAAIAFVLIGYFAFKPGFPLDDAWIHQTYARNLAETGHWEFNQGEKSAGSTSPLWTLLLAISPLLKISNPIIWTTILSTVCFAAVAVVSVEQIRNLGQSSGRILFFAATIIILDWHLLWGVGSGMEVILSALAIGTTFLLLQSLHPRWFLIGVLIGLSVWIRPDGITLLGPAIVILVYKIIKNTSTKKTTIFFLLGLIIPLILYGVMNFTLSGKLLPSTFFAKQAEYIQLKQVSLFIRYFREFLILISGAGFLFLPGFVFSIWHGIKNRNIWLMSAIAWILGFCLLYAMRLPVTYQHGRYLIPAICTFYVVGIYGSLQILDTGIGKKIFNKTRTAMIFTIAVIISFVFMVIGEGAYIQDLKTIDRLMVQPAQWIKQNTDANGFIAAHDIGALGYFADRKILDLAGLIQPEIIPDINNQEKILEIIQKSDAKYLVAFQDWYPILDNYGTVLISYDLRIGNEMYIVEIKKIKDN
jgi:hypothetical protein